MQDEATIGARLRALRRWRGMTLDELAGLSGLSKSFLSRAERGLRAIDRRSHIAALSSALRVSETDLVGGPHLTADPVQAEPHTTIPVVRTALMSNTLTAPATDRARPLDDLVAEMERIDRSKLKHTVVGQRLPALLDELHVHACAPADEAAHRLALETLIEAFQSATFICKDLGYGDLAAIAAMRANDTAAILDQPMTTGKAATLRIHTMPPGTRQASLEMAERAADAMEPHVRSDLDVQVLGMITLAASLAATVSYNYDRAGHWLDQAAALATRTPDDPGANWGAFSSTNVKVWRVALATERGASGGDLLTLAADVNESRLESRRGRRAAFLADVGRGVARDPRMQREAVRWLRRAEAVAPHKIRNSAAVRETVATMLTRSSAQAGGRELRGMAARMGVAH